MKIVVIDSGISYHPKYNGEYAGIHLYYDQNHSIVMNYDIEDSLGHGTAVNCLIHRIVPEASLFNIRIYEDEFYNDCEDLLLSALDYIDSSLECQIVNISSGVICCHNPNRMEKKLEKLYERGIVIVSAFHNVGSMSLPASSKYVIGVDSSLCINNELEYIYRENSLINVEAKGGLQRLPWKNGTYIADSGTSYATAHITGIIARMILTDSTINAKNVHKNLKKNATQVQTTCRSQKPKKPQFKIENAVLYPYNKEMHSLVKFYDLLSFNISHIYSNKYMLNIIKMESDRFRIEDVKAMCMEDFDTLILGHVSEMNKLTGCEHIKEIILKCIQSKKNIYAFDDSMYQYYLSLKGNPAQFFFPSVTKQDVPYETNGKLYNISKPVLGVFGTDSNQGKFTLQLELRKRFLEVGYKIEQLGTEPNSLLFGFNHIYPMGFNKEVFIHSQEAVATINNYMHGMEIKDPDIILVGCQSGTAPEANYHLDHLNFPQYEFLLGTQPDTVILCVSAYQNADFVNRNVQFIEAATNATVIALVLFPLIRKMQITSNLKRFQRIENNERFHICESLSKETGLPCFDLDSSENLDLLFEYIISYYEE